MRRTVEGLYQGRDCALRTHDEFKISRHSRTLTNLRVGLLIATASPDGQPHVVPVGFRYNPKEDAIEIGGHSGFAKRKKYRDVVQNPRVAFVVDDVRSVNPWSVRGIEIRGKAEVLTTGGTELGPGFDPEMFRIRPTRIISWELIRMT